MSASIPSSFPSTARSVLDAHMQDRYALRSGEAYSISSIVETDMQSSFVVHFTRYYFSSIRNCSVREVRALCIKAVSGRYVHWTITWDMMC